MQRTRLLIGALALVLVAGACGGGDDGGASDGDGATEAAETTETTEAPEDAPVNPEGDFVAVRWIRENDNPPTISNVGLAATRLWTLAPECGDDDEPCDLELTGGGEGGGYDPEGFPAAEDIPDPATLEWDDDAETWILEEDLGPYANCRTADNEYLDGDFTTMDQFDRTELRWDGDRLVGTKTETATLNDAGLANPECSPDSDETVTYDLVLVPEDEFEADVEETVELADSYRLTRDVFAVEGTELLEVYQWEVFGDDASGEGTCGPDECDATLIGPFEPSQELELEYDDGELTASWSGTGSCASADAITSGSDEVLTEEGYESTWEVEVHPVTVNEDGDQVLVTRGEFISTPLPEAAEQFPEDCDRVETVGAYWTFVPTDLVG